MYNEAGTITALTEIMSYPEVTLTPKKDNPALVCDTCGHLVFPRIIECLPKKEYWHKDIPKLRYCTTMAFCSNPDCGAPMGWL